MPDNKIEQLDLTSGKNLVSGWDWESRHVNQSFTIGGKATDLAVQDIVESGTVLIAAGPADLSRAIYSAGRSNSATIEGIRVVPIGLVETATVALSRPLSRLFEIGSKLSYIIAGRTVGEIALARVLFDGPSLLKVLYQGEVVSDVYDGGTEGGQKKTIFRSGDGKTITSQPIGSGNIAMNLASKFFDQSVGLAFYFRDNENDDVSQIYFEGCKVSTYNLGIAANMNVLTESVRMEFVQCTPITSSAFSGNPDPSSYKYNADTVGLTDIPVIGQTRT